MDSILQTTLANVIQQLANFFGMTTETIMKNAPMWLAKYGWFTLMKNLPVIVFLWVLAIAGLFALIIYAGYYCEWKVKHIISLCTLSFFVSALIIFGAWFMQCAVAPEMYGLNAILSLLKS